MFPLTEEQEEAVKSAAHGDDIAIQALAGTGKTTTLRSIADRLPGRSLYLAFNRALVEEAREKFANTGVEARTSHSMAWPDFGSKFSHRLSNKARRLNGMQLAYALQSTPVEVENDSGDPVKLSEAQVVGYVKQMLDGFCVSGDPDILGRHLPPTTGFSSKGRYALAEAIWEQAHRAWKILTNEDSTVPVEHNLYLKLWQLSHPKLSFDTVLFDEVQDANPVLLDVLLRQDTDVQMVFVGDTQQSIYGFNGAVNAFEEAQLPVEAWLTRSFRFGPQIAAEANKVLRVLGSPKLLVGSGKEGVVEKSVGFDVDVDCVLTRTNAAGIEAAVELISLGRNVQLNVDVNSVVSFIAAFNDLAVGKKSSHPDLAPFATLQKVEDYIDAGLADADFVIKVRLAKKISVDQARRLKQECQTPGGVLVTTAHKSKGAEWKRVLVSDDFPVSVDPSKARLEELRLYYVALTRAQEVLYSPGLVS